MKPIKEVCASFKLVPKKYRILGNAIVVEDEKENALVLKRKFKDKKDLYQYLDLRGFNHFPSLLGTIDIYEIYPFIREVELPKEQKALDLVYLMSLLHNKTTFYRAVDLDKVKAFYEEEENELNYLLEYYQSLQDMIEKHVYMSPSEYLLIRNSSFLYGILNLVKKLLEEWYQILSKKQKERYALVHNGLSLNHFIEKDNGYFISWDRAKMDIPVYDFYTFYKENDDTLDYATLLDVYESKYPLLKEEKLRLFILLLTPRKIVLQEDEAKTCRIIHKEFKRLKKVREMVSKEYKEDTEEKKQEFDH